jgi:hypothetical protein
MEQKKIITNLINAANEINEKRKPKANYIQLSTEYIQQLADEQNISFDSMIEIINNKLNK